VFLRRIIVSAIAAFGAAIVSALGITILNLYLVGHGHRGVEDEIVVWPSLDVYLSIGDIVVSVVALVAGIVAWGASRVRRRGS
jgi:hypothetical protein